ncbi:MAG: ATP synthase F0 subunit B [Bryobacteraceae bacterium]
MFHDLGQLLLHALPTFLLVVALNFYLKYMFFKPLEKVLQQRYEATEGARKLAAEALERAAAKTAQYEAALRAARSEVYQAQERAHRQLADRQGAELLAARRRAEQLVREAQRQLAQDAETLQRELVRGSDALADQIADSILRGRAA